MAHFEIRARRERRQSGNGTVYYPGYYTYQIEAKDIDEATDLAAAMLGNDGIKYGFSVYPG